MVELRDGIISIVQFLLGDFGHIEVRLAKKLAGLELLGFLNVHTATPASLGLHKVTGSLTTNPTSGHVGNLRARHQTVHVFIKIDRSAVTVNRHALLQLHHLAEDVVGEPFKGFLGTGRAADHITDGGDNLLHTRLAVVGLQLRQFLEAQGHRHLVGTGRAYQTVNLVEEQRGQLIDDNGDGDVLALAAVDAGDETVEDQGVQGSDDALHLWVISNQQITGIGRV